VRDRGRKRERGKNRRKRLRERGKGETAGETWEKYIRSEKEERD
jgi:hypothetical protein